MNDGLLPPFVEPTGPRYDDVTVVREFAQGDGLGHSEHFHVEGPVLMVDRMVAAAVRIGPRTILVRLDIPDEVFPARPEIERLLADEGLSLVDHDTLLAAPVAIQMIGLRQSDWDLWGADLDEAFARLREAALGQSASPITGLPIAGL